MNLWRERLIASDPDLSRLQTGSRAALSLGIAIVLLERAGLSSSAVVLGGAFAMLSPVAVTDADPRARRLTFALLPVAASAAYLIGTLAAPHRMLGYSLFVVTIFLSVWARRFEARGTAAGLLAFNAFFFSQFLHAELAALPEQLLSICAGIGIGALVRLAILPDRPGRMLRRSLRALPAVIALVLRRLEEVIRRDTLWRTQRVRAPLRKLNEVALTLEDHLQKAKGSGALRQRVFQLELAAERLTASARDLLEERGLPQEVRATLSAAIQCSRRAIGSGASGADCLAAIKEEERRRAANPVLSLFLSRFHLALAELLGASHLGAAVEGERAETPSAAAASVLPAGIHPMTRQAIQAAVAGAAAIVVGHWISQDRWFWAVLTAFLVLSQATSRGEMFVRAWQRTLGTLLGALVGIGLAAAVHGHPRVELALLFAGVFLAFHSLKSSYSVMVLWITAVLAILYSLLGRYSPSILVVRIEETVAGALVGALSAAIVLPSKTGGKISGALASLFSALASDLAHKTEAEGLLESARTLDARLRDLRAAAEPLTGSVFPIGAETVQLVHGASTAVFYARQLATPGVIESALAFHGDLFQQATARASKNAEALGAAFEGRGEVTFVPAAPQLAALRRLAETELGQSMPRNLALAIHWLRRIDDTMSRMVSVLRIAAAPTPSATPGRLATRW